VWSNLIEIEVKEGRNSHSAISVKDQEKSSTEVGGAQGCMKNALMKERDVDTEKKQWGF